MKNNGFQFSQRVAGRERKAIAAVISGAAGGQVRYTGAPGFVYEAGGWSVDRDGAVHSPETSLGEIKSVRPVIEALDGAGLTAEGCLTIKLSADGHGEATLENLKNLLISKETLIKKALGTDGGLAVSVEDGAIVFPFWKATLNADELQTYITLAWRLSEQAKTQKRASQTEKPADNEKYAFRCFLLRLGFIGEEFKTERKVLLGRLCGNSAFRSGSVRRQDDGAAVEDA